MLTTQHKNLLKSLIQNQEVMGIHTLMKQLSVADQKQLKLLLAQSLQDRKIVSCTDSMKIFVELLPQNLNLYFKSFQLAAENYKNDSEFWENLSLLEPLGLFLKTNKAYYRQSLIETWIHGLKPSQNAEALFLNMKVENPLVQLNYLIESDSLYGYYQFLQLALKEDIDANSLAKLIRKLLLPNDKNVLPQNTRLDTANFLWQEFNLPGKPYPFQRELDSTQFAYAEKSYASFLKVIAPANRIQDFLKDL